MGKYEKITCRNYQISFHVAEWQGEKYLAGYIDYIGKMAFRSGNQFIYDCISCRYDFPEIVPSYIKEKLSVLYRKNILTR